MKTSLLIAAAILVVFAGAFAMVRMDLIAADALRFLPAIAAVIVAGGIAISVITGRTRRRRSPRTTIKKEKK